MCDNALTISRFFLRYLLNCQGGARGRGGLLGGESGKENQVKCDF